jgi:plasmid maintenance system killer protein
MKKIRKIIEKKDILPFLKSRGLLQQYKKAKQFILSNNLLRVKFKERKPKGTGIWSFRINKQFRALGVFDEDGDLIVFRIDNHQ